LEPNIYKKTTRRENTLRTYY